MNHANYEPLAQYTSNTGYDDQLPRAEVSYHSHVYLGAPLIDDLFL